ncbi:MAG: CFI-box-CTERM domain-containing protein, partial [Acutalibacteraceae bacterium]
FNKNETPTENEVGQTYHLTADEAAEKAHVIFKAEPIKNNKAKKKKGCYIATCVYGSYDCPPVWTLRRYRDTVMANSVIGRIFIFLYYLLSPTVVKLFGKKQWFVKPVELILNKIVLRLERKGFSGLPYSDA